MNLKKEIDEETKAKNLQSIEKEVFIKTDLAYRQNYYNKTFLELVRHIYLLGTG